MANKSIVFQEYLIADPHWKYRIFCENFITGVTSFQSFQNVCSADLNPVLSIQRTPIASVTSDTERYTKSTNLRVWHYCLDDSCSFYALLFLKRLISVPSYYLAIYFHYCNNLCLLVATIFVFSKLLVSAFCCFSVPARSRHSVSFPLKFITYHIGPTN